MPGSETIKLDPTTEATNRTELDITQFVALDGVDWGNAGIEQYMAQRGGVGGAEPIDYWVPNREITMPLRLQTRGTVSFDQIRTKLQAKVGLAQREGMILGRVTSNGGTVYADVVNASLKLGGGWGQARGRYDENAELHLECLPDWYGPELTASAAHDETSVPGVIWTETGIKGDYPGRVRLVVTERQGADQLGLLWGFRCRNYSSASTAALAYEAENLTAISPAAVATLSGASGGGSNNTVQHASLGANWTPVLNTNQSGSYATHVGSYRVWARVYSTSGTSVSLRFVWDVGDMTNPTTNDDWTFPGASQFYLADLGEIRLDTTTGTHRWQGQLQAKGSSGGESVRIDRLFFQPLDEGAGKLLAPDSSVEGLAAASASDAFNQTAGALTGKSADVGGTWAGAGDAGDFQVEATGHTAQRTDVSDVDSNTGRYGISGVTGFAAQAAQADIKYSFGPAATPLGTSHQGVLARYTDVNNWLRATITPDFTTGQDLVVRVTKRVAGTVTTLLTVTTSVPPNGGWQTIRLVVSAAGVWSVWLANPTGSTFALIGSGQDSVLATGGALASGKPGIYDAQTAATALTRNYDNFAAWVPITDAAVFASQTCEIRTDGMYRKDASGASFGPVTEVTGDLPRVPPAGLESRTLQAMVRPTRGNFDDLPDDTIDDIRAQLFYRACWLYVPDDTGS